MVAVNQQCREMFRLNCYRGYKTLIMPDDKAYHEASNWVFKDERIITASISSQEIPAWHQLASTSD
jgi:hypothetical protein